MVNKAKSSGSVYVGIGGLEFRAVARRVLPGQAAAGEGTELRGLETDRDRDQFDLLRLAEARDLPQMGARDAGRLPVLREGLALLHQPPGAGRRRGLDQALPQFRRDRARRPARPPAVAIRADQEVRRGRLPLVPRAAAGEAGRGEAASRRRGAPRQLPQRRLHRADPRIQRRGRVRRARDLSGHRRRHERLRLSAPAEGQGHDRDRLSAQGAGRLGQALRDVRVRRRAEGSGAGRSRRARRKPHRATCSPT